MASFKFRTSLRTENSESHNVSLITRPLPVLSEIWRQEEPPDKGASEGDGAAVDPGERDSVAERGTNDLGCLAVGRSKRPADGLCGSGVVGVEGEVGHTESLPSLAVLAVEVLSASLRESMCNESTQLALGVTSSCEARLAHSLTRAATISRHDASPLASSRFLMAPSELRNKLSFLRRVSASSSQLVQPWARPRCVRRARARCILVMLEALSWHQENQVTHAAVSVRPTSHRVKNRSAVVRWPLRSDAVCRHAATATKTERLVRRAAACRSSRIVESSAAAASHHFAHEAESCRDIKRLMPRRRQVRICLSSSQ